MKVRSRLFDIPQRGNLEYHLVHVVLGQLVDSLIGLVGPRFHDAKLLIRRPTDIGTGVAPLTPSCGKCVEAGFLGIRQGRLVPLDEGVPCGWSNEPALERSDREGPLLEAT
jgi:hypothetical protein